MIQKNKGQLIYVKKTINNYGNTIIQKMKLIQTLTQNASI